MNGFIIHVSVLKLLQKENGFVLHVQQIWQEEKEESEEGRPMF